MCGRLSQYRGIHDFVAALSMPGALVDNLGGQPLGHYNGAPSMQLALFHVTAGRLYADPVRWGWKPHWAKDRTPPINARAENVAHGPFFRQIWPHRAICHIDSWFEWIDEGDPKKQPYLVKHRDGSPILCASIAQLPDPDQGHGEHDGFVLITADARAEWSTFTTAGPWSWPRTWPGSGWTRPHRKNALNRWPCMRVSPPTPSSGSESAPPSATSGTTGRI